MHRTSKQGHPTRAKQSLYRSRSRRNAKRFIMSHNTRITVSLFALWVIATIIFVFGLSSVVRPYLLASRQSSAIPQKKGLASATLTPPHAIFRVDGINITDTQWHNATQSAFAMRASSGQYLGGNQADTTAINIQTVHTIVDPIAEQEMSKELRLTTNLDALYQQWLKQAPQQEQQAAQQSQSNASDKQQKAQEQLMKDIVAKLTTLPSPNVDSVYSYYQQHPEQFARIEPQMHIQQIVVNSLQTMQKLINQLNQGRPFSAVEAFYDVSGHFYQEHGGDLGWITVGGSGYPPEWSAHVLSLKKGQISAPFQVDGRYYIVKCLEGPDYEPWPFPQVQDQAHQNLVMEQINDAFTHILSQKEKSMHILLLDPQYQLLFQQMETILKNE